MNFSLLEELCSIRGISGDEQSVKNFILNFVEKNSPRWKVQPKVFCGEEFQDGVVLVFGKPRTAVFAHIDTVGYTAGYGANLIKVGGPSAGSGAKLIGKDNVSEIECTLHQDEEGELSYIFEREIERGTCLSYQPNFQLSDEYIETPYLDNRLGVFNALELASTLEDGIIAFSTYEEVGGGCAQVLGRFIYESYGVTQALISDITWVTSGVQHGNGVAISMRDSGIPRKSYLNKIVEIAKSSGVSYQLEVESSGGSDGNVLQNSPYPFSWCFIGAPEDNVHSPNERVAISDIEAMIKLYEMLLMQL